MVWSHFNPVNIQAGAGSRSGLGGCVQGKKILLVTTSGLVRRGTAAEIRALVPDADWTVVTVENNPDLDALESAAAAYKSLGVTDIVALGGGSALDAAKALAPALVSNLARPLAAWLREGFSTKPPKLPEPPAPPVIALPTTAGTGAEVTPFATIWDRAAQKKRSLAGPEIFPRHALLDPELTLTLPPEETLFGALDAASHCLETLWNKAATPVSLALAREGLARLIDSFPLAEENPEHLGARETLQTAALLGGLAISQSRTAVAHSMSYPLTLRLGLPHGLACGFTLKAVAALVDRAGRWPAPGDGELAGRALAVFERSDPCAAALKYGTPARFLELAGEMETPERAGNFVLETTPELFRKILAAALTDRRPQERPCSVTTAVSPGRPGRV